MEIERDTEREDDRVKELETEKRGREAECNRLRFIFAVRGTSD